MCRFINATSELTETTKKLRFLRALQAKMEACCDLGKRVILAGDLNLTLRARDTKLTRRLLHIDSGGSLASGMPEGVQDEPKLAKWSDSWRSVADVAKLTKQPAEVAPC